VAGSGLRGQKGADAERARLTVAAGGEVWVADETGLRAFPPLRAGWARKGEQATVVVSGRNAHRTLHGALNAAAGELVRTVTTTAKAADVVAAVEALGAGRPWAPKPLVWGNAPPHQPKRVREAAALAGVELAFLPFRSAARAGVASERLRTRRGKMSGGHCEPVLVRR
jgi:hypothetical protein